MKIFVFKFVFLGLLLTNLLGDQKGENFALTFLQKNAPEIHISILSLAKLDSDGYQVSLKEAEEAAREHQRLLELGEPEVAAAYLQMYKIDHEAIILADQIVLSDDPENEVRLRKKLSELIDSSFTQWAIVEKARVVRLERRVEALRKDVEEALENRTAVVEQDCEVLLQETRDFRGITK